MVRINIFKDAKTETDPRKDLQKDLQKVALNIKHTLTAAISDQKLDIQTMAHRLTDVEQTSQIHAEVIRQVQRTYDSQLPHIFDL